MKRYDVELTVREHFIVNVVAWSPAQARTKALRGEYEEGSAHECGDRKTIAARARLAEEPVRR